MPKWANCSIGMLLIWGAVGVAPSLARPSTTPRVSPPSNILGVRELAGGAFTLAAQAAVPPRPYAAFSRYGLVDGATTAVDGAVRGATVTWSATTPVGTAIIVAVRGQDPTGRWSAWQDDVVSGAPVSFDTEVRALQARVILLGSQHAAPVIRDLRMVPLRSELTALSWRKKATIAPTYRLRVTREGMVGSHTANGHRIRSNDVYVSLPSWSSLSSLGGHEYEVRLSANGNSIVAPVWDVGPWNHHDNFWDIHRTTYSDLPRGWPEDHAAYYENYHGGMADEGWVRFPTAVDIGDGAYWALGLDGEQAVVDVSFLWLGDDPGADATPLNRGPSHRPSGSVAAADQSAAPAAAAAKPLEHAELAAADGPGFDSNTAAWHSMSCGDAPPARWLAGYPLSAHAALWRPQLAGGSYDVQVHVPLCAGLRPTTQAATYLVHAADGSEHSVTVNQATAPDRWVSLGRFQFAAGTADFVKLSAATPEAGQAVWFDRVRWQQVAP